jgi:hypothetical protein
VAWPDQPEDVALSRRRAFISVYDGSPASLAVTVTYDDGSQATRDFTVPISN